MGLQYNKDWIVPVLKDLEAFLSENGLTEGSRAITEAMTIVKRDIRRSGSAGSGSVECRKPEIRPGGRAPYLTLVSSQPD
ncbi:hypothetical protein GCM10007315_03750 [Gemmobacter tilapiae]|uniref:Uncharacterized protein n=1 Tax=Neogemmobacter tilapiae TaxID=875041 RepID=A0A918TFM5_9RHOB|nr:hypothetical protein GCM10007315_03750 [Gemmobacter tilapiae]